jgi:hypothetical protein
MTDLGSGGSKTRKKANERARTPIPFLVIYAYFALAFMYIIPSHIRIFS